MPYDNLDEEEKEKIRALIFIMDKFSISLEGYHELTQVEKSLPRTYLIESYTKVWTVSGKSHGHQEMLQVQSCR